MEHACIGSLDDLEPGFKGIREPCRGCTKVGPDEVDLVVVPGVAFDRKGRRLGYGGGFYDGFLSTCGAPRIAIAFGVQVVDSVPCDECDLPVGVVITEDEIIEASPGTSPARS
jgi:5-formyltetrahydrofolate cyclo-ligase